MAVQVTYYHIEQFKWKKIMKCNLQQLQNHVEMIYTSWNTHKESGSSESFHSYRYTVTRKTKRRLCSRTQRVELSLADIASVGIPS